MARPEVISQVRKVNWPLALDLLKGVELSKKFSGGAGDGLGHLASTCVEGVAIAVQG